MSENEEVTRGDGGTEDVDVRVRVTPETARAIRAGEFDGISVSGRVVDERGDPDRPPAVDLDAPITSETTRRILDGHDRAISGLVRSRNGLLERVGRLERGRASLEDSSQICDLERAIGMRNHEIELQRKRIEELEETVEIRTVAETGRTRRSLDAALKEIADLRESARRKDGQIAGLVETLRTTRGDFEETERLRIAEVDRVHAELDELRAAPTFSRSAEQIVESVLTVVDSGHENISISTENHAKLIDEIDATFRRAAETPSAVVGFAVVYETVPAPEADEDTATSAVVEDFDDFDEAETRFDELAPVVRAGFLAGVVRRTG